MTELILLNQYQPKPEKSLPVVVIVEPDDEYFEYFSEALKCSNTRLVRAFDFDGAKAYLQSRPAPAVIVFDWIAIGDRTKNFVKWLQGQPKFECTYTILATHELWADSLVRGMAICDWCPRNLPEDQIHEFIVGASQYFEHEQTNH